MGLSLIIQSVIIFTISVSILPEKDNHNLPKEKRKKKKTSQAHVLGLPSHSPGPPRENICPTSHCQAAVITCLLAHLKPGKICGCSAGRHFKRFEPLRYPPFSGDGSWLQKAALNESPLWHRNVPCLDLRLSNDPILSQRTRPL